VFARVVTGQADAEGFDSLVRLAKEQLPEARKQPGFRGFYLLSDDQSGRLMTISLWEPRRPGGRRDTSSATQEPGRTGRDNHRATRRELRSDDVDP
jgi:heme-degrading monooxygenase HmoA